LRLRREETVFLAAVPDEEEFHHSGILSFQRKARQGGDASPLSMCWRCQAT
jgi:hypothetical protein